MVKTTANPRELRRFYRHKRIRKVLRGTPERPRLCVHRSAKNIYAQLIDDVGGEVLFGLSTLNKDVRKQTDSKGGNVPAASVLGKAVAAKAKEKGIESVCFDRGGYLYHGRVKAFAEAAREGGLQF